MKVACLLSGGKDSLYASYIALNCGWDIEWFVTISPERRDSWMFHSVNIEHVPLIAESVGIPLIYRRTHGRKEEELEDLKLAIKDLDIDGIVSGAIASDYQRERISMICEELNIKSFTPLWHKNQESLLRYQIETGFEIMIISVSAQGLDKNWLGTILNDNNVENFIEICRRYRINSSGEGGEFETFVLDCPLYNKKLSVRSGKTVWNGESGFYKIIEIEKKDKSVYDVPKFS